MLVCDAYHAMTSDRPYRLALDAERAKEELLRCAGTQFDPLVVEALLAVLESEDAEPVSAVVRHAQVAGRSAQSR